MRHVIQSVDMILILPNPLIYIYVVRSFSKDTDCVDLRLVDVVAVATHVGTDSQ